MGKLPLPIRIGHRHRRVLHGVFLGTWLTGMLWLLFHHFLTVPGPLGPTPHPLEQWWLRLHGGFAFAMLVAVGSVLPVHARMAWQRNRNRPTGLVLQAWLAWLAATGYGLYYFSSESTETWLPPLHWLPGLALPVVLALHVRLGRRAGLPARDRHRPDPPQQKSLPATESP